MEMHFKPDVQAKLEQMARERGCQSHELVEDAVAVYFDELARTQEMLDRRFDDLETGMVKPIDGEEAYRRLRQTDLYDIRACVAGSNPDTETLRVPMRREAIQLGTSVGSSWSKETHVDSRQIGNRMALGDSCARCGDGAGRPVVGEAEAD